MLGQLREEHGSWQILWKGGRFECCVCRRPDRRGIKRNSLEEAARCSAVVQMRKAGMEGDLASVRMRSERVMSITL